MRRRAAVLLVGLLLQAGHAAAAPPSAGAFFAAPAFDAVRLSPSGEHVAALVATQAGRRLAVMPVARTRARLLAVPADVRDYRWATDERLVLVIGAPGAAPGLAAVNRDGSGFRVLAASDPEGELREGARLLDLLPREPAVVLVSDDRRRPRAPDVFRLNLFTGERELAARNPGRVFRWWTDHLGRVRLALAWSAHDGRLAYVLRHRFGPDGAWQRLHEATLGGAFLTPLAFDSDNRHLFVASSVGRDTTAVQRYDTVTLALQGVVHARPDVDVVAMDPAPGGGVASVRYEAQRPVRVYLDGTEPAGVAWLDRRLPGLEHRVVSRSRDGRRAVVLAHGDREPGRYYLFEREPFRLQALGSRLPWLQGRLGPRRPVDFRARDGRRLTGYLSLPPGPGSGRLPLLVMPHGGPWSRDHWGFDAPAQYFAAQGFAVLQVNFRGSRGFGRDHMMAGRGEWDGAILDDLADGVRWAVGEDIAGAERVAILGASFGGYAALMSAVRYPEMYRAAVSFAAVTDLPRQLDTLRRDGDERAWREWSVMVGDPARDAAGLVNSSPLNHARAFRVPVMLAHGGRDRRVDPAQSRLLARALDRAGLPHRMLVLEDTGHGLEEPAARARFYRDALAFLRGATGPYNVH